TESNRAIEMSPGSCGVLAIVENYLVSGKHARSVTCGRSSFFLGALTWHRAGEPRIAWQRLAQSPNITSGANSVVAAEDWNRSAPDVGSSRASGCSWPSSEVHRMNPNGRSTTHCRHPNCYDGNLTQTCRSAAVTVRSKTTHCRRPTGRRQRQQCSEEPPVFHGCRA